MGSHCYWVLLTLLASKSSSASPCGISKTSLLLISLSGLDSKDLLQMDRIQSSLLTLQLIIARYEGFTFQFSVEGKCLLVASCFGAPGMLHDNDAIRATKAALTIRKDLSRYGLRVWFSVTTGMAICGSFGSSQRRSFMVLGEVFDNAHNLNQSTQNDSLCDTETHEASKGIIAFEKLADRQIDTKFISVYRPLGEIDRMQTPVNVGGHAIIGRTKQLEQVVPKIQNVNEGL
jgi:hypothetical protein